MTHIVLRPVRQAQPRLNGRSASCSAEARTVAPSQMAARMKNAIAISSHTITIRATTAMWSLSQVMTCF